MFFAVAVFLLRIRLFTAFLGSVIFGTLRYVVADCYAAVKLRRIKYHVSFFCLSHFLCVIFSTVLLRFFDAVAWHIGNSVSSRSSYVGTYQLAVKRVGSFFVARF